MDLCKSLFLSMLNVGPVLSCMSERSGGSQQRWLAVTSHYADACTCTRPGS